MYYLLIFITSIYLSSRGNLLYDNLTGVSLMPKYHIAVICYIVFCAVFFCCKMKKIYQYIPQSKIPYSFFIHLTAIIMSLGAFFPYTLNQNDLSSIIHVAFSMFGCVSFLGLLLIYTRQLSFYNPHLYLRIHCFFDISLQFLCLSLIIFTRVNGYVEIFYAFIVCTYLYLIEKNIN